MSDQSPYKVFVSYSTPDQPWAREFAAALRSEGIDVWSDTSELAPGDRWMERVEDALRESEALVLVVSSKMLRSPWAYFELGAAVAGQKRIIPVLTEDVSPEHVPASLAQYRLFRESSPQEAGRRVADALTKLRAA